jgi:hypothetical protein
MIRLDLILDIVGRCHFVYADREDLERCTEGFGYYEREMYRKTAYECDLHECPAPTEPESHWSYRALAVRDAQ